MLLTPPPRLWMAILALTGVSVLAMNLAFAAPPPPPSFQDFTISNSTGADITDLELKLYRAIGPKYEKMNPTPISLTMSELPHDASVVVTLKKGWGVMRVTASAKLGGKPLQQMLAINAPLMDCDADNDDEYPGFCHQAPSGKLNYKPALEFRSEGGMAVGELRAKWRWGSVWAPSPVTDKKPFQ